MSLTSLYRPKNEYNLNTNDESIGAIQSKLLIAASEFLYYRYLGYDQIVEILHNEIQAYNINNKSAICDFFINNEFNFPIASIKADAISNSVNIEYEEGLDENDCESEYEEELDGNDYESEYENEEAIGRKDNDLEGT